MVHLETHAFVHDQRVWLYSARNPSKDSLSRLLPCGFVFGFLFVCFFKCIALQTKDFSYCLIIETKQTPKITFQKQPAEASMCHCLRGANGSGSCPGLRKLLNKEPV